MIWEARRPRPTRGIKPVIGPDVRVGTIPEGQVFRNEFASHSRVETYEDCPLSFWARYVAGVKSDPTEAADPLTFGSAMHEALEYYVRSLRDQQYEGPHREARLWEVVLDRMTHHSVTDPEALNDAKEIVTLYCDHFKHFDWKRIVGIEVPFKIDLPGLPMPVVGFIDLIERSPNGKIRVIDYKTNRAIFSRGAVESSIQLALYDHVAARMFPDTADRESVFYLMRHGIEMRTEFDVDRSAACLERFIVLALQTERVRTFPGKPNPNCAYCAFRPKCPEFAKVRADASETVPGFDERDPHHVIARVEALSGLAKALYAEKERLSDYLRAALWRSVDHDGKRWKTSWEWPREVVDGRAIVDALAKALREDPTDLALRLGKLSVTEIDKAFKAHMKEEGRALSPAEDAALLATIEGAMTSSPRAKVSGVKIR